MKIVFVFVNLQELRSVLIDHENIANTKYRNMKIDKAAGMVNHEYVNCCEEAYKKSQQYINKEV
jgi:hypothetical protein